ncbi:MAG: exosortase/archaeosortase family protein [Ferruginibacter sp.]
MKEEGLKKGLLNTSYNKQIRWFFIKLAILGSLWFVSYHLILKPGRIIDRPLTNFLTAVSTKCINLISPGSAELTWKENKAKDCAYLLQNGKQVFGIWDACNGIDLMYIYVGVILLLPYPAKRKAVFGIVGVLVIVFANVIRICSLYFISIYQRSIFDFSHHYLFTILMYILIFYGWLLYAKGGFINKKQFANG